MATLRTREKAFALSVISLFLLIVPGRSFAAPGPRDSENPPALQAEATADTQTSNTACYFSDNGNVTWKWGLTSTNAWYSFSGAWISTPYTKLEKFKTTASYADIYDSCRNSQKYYGVKGDLFAIFAATSNTGSNYPILVGGGDLFAEY